MADSNENNKKNTDLREGLINNDILPNRDSNLLHHLDSLNKIRFSNNFFGLGSFVTVVEFEDDEAVIITKFNDRKIKTKYINKEKFLSKLEKLHLDEWKRYYTSNKLDGHIWNLTLYFDNNEIIKTGGNSSYPENFKKLRKLLKVGKLKYPKFNSLL